MNYCFGAIFRLMHYSTKTGVQQYLLGQEILKVFDASYVPTVDDAKISKLYNCGEGLSRDGTITPARNMSLEDVKKGVATYVLPLIDQNNYRVLVLAIRQVILDDTDIREEVNIGPFTKGELRSKTDYDFLLTIASFLQYACVNTKNKAGKPFIDKITPDYLNSFKSKENSISIGQISIQSSSVLNNTVDPDSFLEAFHEVDADLSLGLKNNNQLRLFRLACDEGKYYYDALNEFLLDNIGAYVYSRENKKELENKNKASSIGVRAMRIMNQNGLTGTASVGNDLAQMLVYAMLEQGLGAPKILSKVEQVQLGSSFISRSDSIHFFAYEENGKKIYELVFGAADISLGLKEAVDRAMETVESISQDSRREKGIVNATLLNRTFDDETTAYLKSILLPSKQSVQRPNMAFGIFLGYSIDVKSDVNHFEEDAADKLEADVIDIIPHIVDKINQLGLADRSFYVFFLPFNDAVKDKIAIMEDLLSVGGGK